MGLPALSDVLAEDQSEPNTLDNVLATPPPASNENTFSFDSQMAAHQQALSTGLNGAGNTPSVAVAPASPLIEEGGGAQRPGETEWNFNMRSFGSGFKPEAYDPTSLQNVNDPRDDQAARVTEDKSLGIFQPIAYDPSSLQNANDSLATRLVKQFAAQPVQVPALQTQAPKARQDMRYQYLQGSEGALPSPVAAPPLASNVAKKKKPIFQTQTY